MNGNSAYKVANQVLSPCLVGLKLGAGLMTLARAHSQCKAQLAWATLLSSQQPVLSSGQASW